MDDFILTPDDPKLTAYALGELEGEDLVAVEEALRRNPALRATVDEIRAATTQLEAALAAEPEAESIAAAAAASPMHAKPVADEYRRPKRGPLGQLFQFPQVYFVVGGLAAACFVVLAIVHGPPPPSRPAVAHTAPAAPDDPSRVPLTIVSNDLKTGKENRMTVAVTVDELKKADADAPVAAPPAKAASEPEPKPLVSVAQNEPAPVAPAADTVANPTPPPAIEGGKALATTEPTTPAPSPEKTIAVIAPKPVELATTNEPKPAPAPAPATTKGTLAFANPPAPKMAPANDEPVALSAFQVSTDRVSPNALRAAEPGVASNGKPIARRGATFARTPAGRDANRDNDFLGAEENPRSSFPVEVDLGSYAQVRAAIERGRLPAREAVRIEELVNYFPYRYAPPLAREDVPFAAALEVAEAPWAPTHRLVRIGLKGRDPSTSDRLLTIAKDVKVEVTFNPAKVSSYRLIGFENARLNPDDFEKIDGAEISAGHVITALYEVVPVGAEERRNADKPPADNLLYQGNVVVSSRLETATTTKVLKDELLNVAVGYRKPNALFSFDTHKDFPLTDSGRRFADASADFKFAAAVAEFGMILRNSPHKGAGTMRDVVAWAGAGAANVVDDPRGYRSEFIALARKAQALIR